jgi:serine/tyrosine/threonine adenylyltransferase
MASKFTETDVGWELEHSYTELPQLFYSIIEPKPVRSPKLVKLNEDLAGELGLNIDALKEVEGTAVLAGNAMPPGALPLAQAYAGHQFGNFTMLGDGRALMIGEHMTPDGRRVDIQLKGSGKTPYSRGGDGRAALGPMLREYIMSEAMHALGVRTNRSLSVVTTGDPVYRENIEQGAVLARVASSHIRVGTFEFARGGGSEEDLQKLADYTIARHFPEIQEKEDRYSAMLEEVVKRQAALIADWQLVGFIHGVMNTDNMVLSGETIDYGPCAFMNTYHPDTSFSSIDVRGRYAYANQRMIGGWNLARLAEAMLPLFHEDSEKAVEIAQEIVGRYTTWFDKHWLDGMRAKLGLSGEEKEDEQLVEDLLSMMKDEKADFTNTFRSLTLGCPEATPLAGTEAFDSWYKRWKERLERQQESEDAVRERMKQHNPSVIPRNHRVEEALEAAVKHSDYSVMDNLLDVLSDPYAYTAEQEAYTEPPAPSTMPYRTFCGT